MITILLLVADMWHYMLTGTTFLHYGPDAIMAVVYVFVGGFFAVVECSAIGTITEEIGKTNVTSQKQK